MWKKLSGSFMFFLVCNQKLSYLEIHMRILIFAYSNTSSNPFKAIVGQKLKLVSDYAFLFSIPLVSIGMLIFS